MNHQRSRIRGEIGLAAADGAADTRPTPRGGSRIEAANRFFPDGFAVWDRQSRGFVHHGFMGQQLFETLEEAEAVAGPQQIVVELTPPAPQQGRGAVVPATGQEDFPPGTDVGRGDRKEINDREFNVVVPKTDNSGNDIKTDELEEIVLRMADRFGGVTVHPSVAGCWENDDGELMCEENLILSSGRDSNDGVRFASDEAWVEDLADDIGEEFGQAAVMVSEDVTEVDFVPGEFKEELPGSKTGRDLFEELL